ncbi:blue copper protein-like [Papaver somniferum]|uniref:blue copper protein-like n=1 Tax=Papaver somniferum TaxID=3469 RepID=UPI000E6F893D|nr:blue copper protein-like [Papaver somniferum]
MAKAGVVVLCAISVFFSCFMLSLATDYTVGDTAGWASGVNYDTWLTGKTFAVGDTLVFNYGSGAHSVAEVSKSDYEGCSSANALASESDGATTITLNKAGTRYFICGIPGHCSNGMKLAVTVGAAGGTGTGGSTTTPTPTPTTTTPTTTTPTTSSPSSSFVLVPSVTMLFFTLMSFLML